MKLNTSAVVFLLLPFINAQAFNVDVNRISQQTAEAQETGQPKFQQSASVQAGAGASTTPKSPIDGSPQSKGNGNNNPNDGYEGYRLTQTGNKDSTYYETANTRTPTSDEKEKPDKPPMNVTLQKEPDVFLNATVHVSEISLTVMVRLNTVFGEPI
jgi:hypothetical protein